MSGKYCCRCLFKLNFGWLYSNVTTAYNPKTCVQVFLSVLSFHSDTVEQDGALPGLTLGLSGGVVGLLCLRGGHVEKAMAHLAHT